MTDSATAASMHPASGCVDCHDDEATLSATHEGKTTADLAPKRLKKTAVAEQTCEACHSRDDIKSRAAQSTVLTDVNGTTVNPHDLPVHDSHSEIVCSDCHKVHADASELAEDAQQLCQSCHHSGVYECYTCHEHD